MPKGPGTNGWHPSAKGLLLEVQGFEAGGDTPLPYFSEKKKKGHTQDWNLSQHKTSCKSIKIDTSLPFMNVELINAKIVCYLNMAQFDSTRFAHHMSL